MQAQLDRHGRRIALRDSAIGLAIPWVVIAVLAGIEPGRARTNNFFDAGALTLLGLFAIPAVIAFLVPWLIVRTGNHREYRLDERLKNLAFGALTGVGAAMPIFFVLAIGAADACVAEPAGAVCLGFTSGFVADFPGFTCLAVVYFVAAVVARRHAQRVRDRSGWRPD